MPEIHKIISVYGNSGSYKTTVSVDLAKALSQLDGDADIAIVGLDTTKPLIPILFPGTKNTASLGKLFSIENLDQDAILSELNMDGQIGVIGYNTGENSNSFAYPTDSRIDDFITQMRHLCNYTIIDCTSNVTVGKMTSKSLINADNVIHLISCDINGLVFYHSQEPVLLNEQYGYGNFSRYLTLTGKFIEDIDAMKNTIPSVSGIIPYSEHIAPLWNNGEAFKEVPDSYYNKAIKEIAALVMED